MLREEISLDEIVMTPMAQELWSRLDEDRREGMRSAFLRWVDGTGAVEWAVRRYPRYELLALIVDRLAEFTWAVFPNGTVVLANLGPISGISSTTCQ